MSGGVRGRLPGRKVGAGELVAGYNRFGHDRIGATTRSRRPGRLRVVKVGPCRVDGEHVSSTVIRRLLDEGKTAEPNCYLDVPAKPKNKENMLSHDCQIRVVQAHRPDDHLPPFESSATTKPSAASSCALGMSFAEVERRGIMMPILEVQSKYRKPAYFDELP